MAPPNYPNNVIQDKDKLKILDKINKGISARAANGNEDVKVTQNFKSGTILIKARDRISVEYVRYTIKDVGAQLGYQLRLEIGE